MNSKMLDEVHVAHGIALAQYRAAADAKLKRVLEYVRRYDPERAAHTRKWWDGFDDALDAVARAWEEDHG